MLNQSVHLHFHKIFWTLFYIVQICISWKWCSMKVFYQKKFQPIALSQYCLFFILMYVEVPSFFQVTYNNLIINVLHIRYFPPEEEGSLMASRDWLYGACNAAGSSIPIYGLHIRLPPYQPVWKVPLHTHRKSKIYPHAPTTHAQFTNPFRTHLRTHIARAEVR